MRALNERQSEYLRELKLYGETNGYHDTDRLEELWWSFSEQEMEELDRVLKTLW
jgi:hypothetical protein